MGRKRILREYNVYMRYKRNGNTHKIAGVEAFNQLEAIRIAIRRMAPEVYSAVTRVEVVRKVGVLVSPDRPRHLEAGR